MASVELTSFTFTYGGAWRPALDGVDLRVDGGLVLVSGASGSGKSTLLRVLDGLVPHFHGGMVSGAARVAGQNVLTTPTRVLARHVGLVFQDPETQLLGGSVEREVAFGLENLGVGRRAMRARVDDALVLCGLEALRARPVAALSGGERQRAAIAAAVAMGVEIVALDEPTSQLDVAGAEAVTRLCERLAAEGTTVVVAEHRLERLLPVASALVLCDAGRVDGGRPPAAAAAFLAAPPQVVELGLRASLSPLPLRPSEVSPRLRRTVLPVGDSRGGEEAWSTTGVTVGFGRRSVLEGVEADGRAGEVVALVGPNGGGKTTLLRCVAGLVAPLVGAVWRRRGRVAYLPQNPAALLTMASVHAEVALTLRRTGEADDVVGVLERAGLGEVAARHPRDLSSGERQRTAIAAILCGAPSLVVLDEPTRGMDGRARRLLVAMVRDLAARGAAVLLATHDVDLVAALADRVVEVASGGVRQLGTVRTALTGASPYATQLGALWARGPVTVDEALALL